MLFVQTVASPSPEVWAAPADWLSQEATSARGQTAALDLTLPGAPHSPPSPLAAAGQAQDMVLDDSPVWLAVAPQADADALTWTTAASSRVPVPAAAAPEPPSAGSELGGIALLLGGLLVLAGWRRARR